MSQQIRVIMINGPLRSGKDTCARLIKRITKDDAVVLRAIDPVKEAVHTLFDLPRDPDFLETRKDYSEPELYGRTPRSAYISLTEDWLKANWGDDILGRLLWKKIYRIAAGGQNLFCIPGVGQGPEVRVIRSHLRPEQIVLIHLHRSLTDFKGDTRGYITIDGVTPTVVKNTGTIRDLEKILARIVNPATVEA